MRLSSAHLVVISLAITTALASPVLGRQKDKPASPPATQPASNQELRKELLGMTKEDQAARKAMIGEKGCKPDSAAAKRIEAIDKVNTAGMKEIVDQYGWPGKSLVGKDGANAAWLLVQHADRDPAFQKRCLELLREAQKKGEVSGQELAYLTDRVRVAQGENQLYGTQFHTVDGNLWPHSI